MSFKPLDTGANRAADDTGDAGDTGNITPLPLPQPPPSPPKENFVSQRASFDRSFKQQNDRYEQINPNLNPNRSRTGQVTGVDNGLLVAPSSEAAEAALVGSIIIDRDAIVDVVNIVKPSDFWFSDYGRVYQCVVELYLNRIPADIITLKNELLKHGWLGNEEGQIKPGMLVAMMRSSATPVHARFYAGIVKQKAIARRCVERNSQFLNKYWSPDADVEKLLAQEMDQLKKDLAWVKQNQNNSRFLDHSQSLNYMERIEEASRAQNELIAQQAAGLGLKPGQRLPRLRFGWAAFDGKDYQNPPLVILQPSLFMVLLARTSVGKTIFAECLAEANAAAGNDVLYVLTELSTKQMEDRRICRHSNMSYSALALEENEPGSMTGDDWSEVAKAMNTINSWSGREDFFYASGYTADEIVSEIEARQAMLETTQKRRYRLIVVDYIGRVLPNKYKERSSEAEQTKNVLQTLSDACGRMGVAMLALSQVTREASKSEDGLTVTSGIGTSAIEQFANLLIALEKSKTDDNSVVLRCLKYTFGSTDWQVTLRHQKNKFKFLEGDGTAEGDGGAVPVRRQATVRAESRPAPAYGQQRQTTGHAPEPIEIRRAFPGRQAQPTGTVPDYDEDDVELSWGDIDDYGPSGTTVVIPPNQAPF